MMYTFYDNLPETPYMKEVWQILCECDKEFFPALSSRENSRQMNLTGLTTETIYPKSYYDRMVKQNFILAFDEGKVVGFMTFINGYESEELKTIGPSNYITTICVTNDYRGRGIMGDLYHFMKYDVPEAYQQPYISTRTWSGNDNHLKGLKHQGFDTILRMKDHRGPGIDTVYFAYEVEGD